MTNREERVTAGSVLTTQTGRELLVLRSTAHQSRYIVTFEGLQGIDDAEAIRGERLFAPPLDDPDALWVHELIGSEVETVSGEVVGVVESVQANPASDLLVLDGGAMIPLRFVVGRSQGGRVRVDIPDGLLDLSVTVPPDPILPPTLRIEVFTLFPEVIEHYADASILGRARVRGQLDLRTHDVRSVAREPHRSVDDAPFGGGAGMVLGPEPVFDAVEAAEATPEGLPRPLVLMSPSGRPFDQQAAKDLAQTSGFSLLCGRYEGVDQRVGDHLVDAEISVGDFVLAGGELAALVVVEAVVRLVPGVLGNDQSAGDESFSTGLLEYPQYTRPAVFRGWSVPEILRSGDHARGRSLAPGPGPDPDAAAPPRPDRRAGGPLRGGGQTAGGAR